MQYTGIIYVYAYRRALHICVYRSASLLQHVVVLLPLPGQHWYTPPGIPVRSMTIHAYWMMMNKMMANVMQVYMTQSDAVVSVNCTIDLIDSQSQITDTDVLMFSVNATVFEPLPDPLPPPEQKTVETFSPPVVATCIDACGMFNAACLWWKGCTRELVKMFGGIVGGLVGRATPCSRFRCTTCESPVNFDLSVLNRF
jgi:hypothetical protein